MKRNDLQAQLRTIEHYLMLREIEFDNLVGKSTGELAEDAARFAMGLLASSPPLPTPTTEELDRLLGQQTRSVKDRVLEHFRLFPSVDFSTHDVMRCLHLGDSQSDAVRKAIQRLADERALVRTVRGHYQLHPDVPHARQVSETE
jgi:hypothetical protein